ncbi:hypothetical protein KFL_004300120 [Klebsormidium nitens]|uniref:Alkyl hydroperoxide reductase subunit C/ Thiol specific antioxidant domain-containing protein n=1 Tax=Klebsormidium nitens TaxID=105231 RepID=A0A1Y1IHC8_KLENI|nr:hypothetical protein KFL_004300120 [Klebsormidium nitens]|eukprot:GAQ88461.1 hypothetical protein KFL_004300120 [Klebsormidium nitens]
MGERADKKREILSPRDPMEWWANEFKSRSLTGLIWERGDWCPFCRYDVSQWREQLPNLEALGGTFFIVTAQDQESLEHSASNWGLDHLTIVSDPENVLAREYGLAITTEAIRAGAQCHYEPYTNGVCQPGYVIMNQLGVEIAGWRQHPTEGNNGGALDRPIPARVMSFVRSHVKQTPTEVQDPNDPLDDLAQLVEEVFDALPEDIQALLREQNRLPSDSKRMVAPDACEACVQHCACPA